MHGNAGMVLEIVIGMIGLIGCGFKYPIYRKMLEKGKAKYAYEIVSLSHEIADQSICIAGSGNMNKAESKYFNAATTMDLASISLLGEIPFDYITVSEIYETAGGNRSTFYLHYETAGDLLNEAPRYLFNDF